MNTALYLNESTWFGPGSDPCRDAWARIICNSEDRIESIDLAGAGARYPQSTPDRADYEQATARCKGMGAAVTCEGLPPRGCSAFVGPGGESYRLSVTDPNVCDECPPKEQMASVWAFFIIVTIAGFSAVVLYIYFVLKWPEALKRWGSTLAIIVGHMQVLTIIGGLRLELPMTLRIVLEFFDVFSLPDAACLFGDVSLGTLSPFWMFAATSCAFLLALLLVVLACRLYFEQRSKTVRADAAEFTLSIIFCVQLTSAWRVAFSVIISYLFNRTQLINESSIPPIAFVISVLLLLTHAILIVRYTSMVIAVKGLETDTKREKKGWLFRHAISPRRLEAQARYLTIRFGAHARRW